MNTSYRTIPAALAFAAACTSVSAAPLDALLSANHDPTPGKVEVELSYDMMNSSLDFLGLRDKNVSSSSVGDYKGGHIRAGIAITPRLWVDGAFWDRKIDYRSFDAELNSWQVAAQYKVFEGAGYTPAVAVRLGAWGNYAESLTKHSNTTVAGTKFTSATVTKPKDNQFQLDLISSWPLSDQAEVSLFAGGGASRVKFDSVNATSRTANGCEYNLSFSPTGVEGMLAKPCSAKIVVTRFTQPTSETVNVYKEAAYKSSYYQAGFSTSWHSVNWHLRAGYKYQAIKRNDVDNIIVSRGDTAYKHNHVLTSEVSYNAFTNVVVFVRGQFMSNQFNGELPLAYNSLTAEKYDQKYGIVSTGLIFVF